jgi:hypothetical protein
MTAMLYFSPKLSEIWHTLLVYAFNIWQTKLKILTTSSLTTLNPKSQQKMHDDPSTLDNMPGGIENNQSI